MNQSVPVSFEAYFCSCLSFAYQHVSTAGEFDDIQLQQQITVECHSYGALLLKMLRSSEQYVCHAYAVEFSIFVCRHSLQLVVALTLFCFLAVEFRVSSTFRLVGVALDCVKKFVFLWILYQSSHDNSNATQ